MKSNPIPSLETLVAQFHQAQSSFLESQEYMDYYWTLDELTFEVERPRSKLVYPLIPVGTWSPMTEVFTWAFAVSHFPEQARFAAGALKGIGKRFMHLEYDASKFELSHMELDDLLAMARYQLQAEIVFKEKAMMPWLFFALLNPSKKDSPQLKNSGY
ncbi:MAG: hypothetical protein JXR76_29110 [Deltaproteobacteria bacterium]|nr:hypothetical protein [Deltaproteobacteria bacterium]